MIVSQFPPTILDFSANSINGGTFFCESGPNVTTTKPLLPNVRLCKLVKGKITCTKGSVLSYNSRRRLESKESLTIKAKKSQITI